MPRDERRGTRAEDLLSAREGAAREDSGNGGLLVGFQGPNGTRPIQGDDAFPYVMVPNDTSEAWLYHDAALGTATSLNSFALQGMPAIDVRGYRRLTFFLQFVLPYVVGAPPPDVPTNALMFLPQVASDKVQPYAQPNSSFAYAPVNDGEHPFQWFGISVIDPVIRGTAPTVTSPTTSILPVQYGMRNVYMTQLNVPYPSTAVPQRVEVETTLVFDVSPYEWFRLRAAKVNDGRGADTNTPVRTLAGGEEICRIWAMKER